MKLFTMVCLLCLAHPGSAAEKNFEAGRAARTPMSQAEKAGRYDALILKHAQGHRLNPRLVKSIIAAESGFYDGAVSPKGARGLMQVMPITAEELGVPRSQLHDPDSNLRAGTAYLDLLCSRARAIYALKGADCRDAPLWVQESIVAAYHAGPRQFHHDPDRWPLKTRLYVRQVFLYYRSPATMLRTRPIIWTPAEPAQSILAKL